MAHFFNQTIAFIGAGHMAGAMMGGLMANQYPAEKIWAANPTSEKLRLLKERFGINMTNDNREAAAKADILVIAVRPALVETVLKELADIIQQRQMLILSVATGVQTTRMAELLRAEIPLIRCMPNMAAMVGSSATALYATPSTSETQRELAESIMRSVGMTVWVEKESQLDAITALSGSGPGYFFWIMEAMVEAGVALGLNREMAELLVIQTGFGSAKLALESRLDLEHLRQSVAVPGGTTEAGMKIFEGRQLKEILAEGIGAAEKRAHELSQS